MTRGEMDKLSTLGERMASVETAMASMQRTIESNHTASKDDIDKLTKSMASLQKQLSEFNNIMQQAKGARWLVGILFIAATFLGFKGQALWAWVISR